MANMEVTGGSPDLTGLPWQTAERCDSFANCVERAVVPSAIAKEIGSGAIGLVAYHDSMNTSYGLGDTLVVPAAADAVFFADIKAGVYDNLH